MMAASSTQLLPDRRRMPVAGRARTLAWPLAVLLVGNVLASDGALALVVHLKHRQVRYEAVRGDALPVVLVRLEEHPLIEADDVDQPAAPLTGPDPVGDEVGLAVRVVANFSARLGAARARVGVRTMRGVGQAGVTNCPRLRGSQTSGNSYLSSLAAGESRK